MADSATSVQTLQAANASKIWSYWWLQPVRSGLTGVHRWSAPAAAASKTRSYRQLPPVRPDLTGGHCQVSPGLIVSSELTWQQLPMITECLLTTCPVQRESFPSSSTIFMTFFMMQENYFTLSSSPKHPPATASTKNVSLKMVPMAPV